MGGRNEIRPAKVFTRDPRRYRLRLLASLRQEWTSMLKESNCCCVVLVGSRTGAIPVGSAYLFLPVSSGSASLAKP
jgi:hypothetical protein